MIPSVLVSRSLTQVAQTPVSSIAVRCTYNCDSTVEETHMALRSDQAELFTKEKGFDSLPPGKTVLSVRAILNRSSGDLEDLIDRVKNFAICVQRSGSVISTRAEGVEGQETALRPSIEAQQRDIEQRIQELDTHLTNLKEQLIQFKIDQGLRRSAVTRLVRWVDKNNRETTSSLIRWARANCEYLEDTRRDFKSIAQTIIRGSAVQEDFETAASI